MRDNMKLFDDFFRSINFDYKIVDEYKTIYVLVSGGYDSTLLLEYFSAHYRDRVVAVNCYNPYENSRTLKEIRKRYRYIEIKPAKGLDYKQILEDAFLMLNRQAIERHKGVYDKKGFNCCYNIKHKAFLSDPLFKQSGCVVISGIKAGDGKHRYYFLKKIRDQDTFFHRHAGGQLYCYPFRDYRHKELPPEIKLKLKEKYPTISHSGCVVCPVIVLFNLEKESSRYYRSLNYLKRLIDEGKFKPNKYLLKYNPKIANTYLTEVL